MVSRDVTRSDVLCVQKDKFTCFAREVATLPGTERLSFLFAFLSCSVYW